MSWKIKEKLRAVLAQEEGFIKKDPGGKVSIALVYPNLYEVGMANLAVHTLYGLLGANDRVVCERFFLPTSDTLKEHLRSRTPLLSLESQRPLADFDIIALTLSFENDALGIIPMLKASGIAHRASERGPKTPLVIAGGAGPTLNPLPLQALVDATARGEVEAHGDTLDILASGTSKQEMLAALSTLPGIVTSAHTPEEARDTLTQHVDQLDAFRTETAIHYKQGPFSDMHLIEVERGCPRHCRFCATPAIYGKPRRRSAKAVLAMAEKAFPTRTKIGLIGADILSHPEFKRIAETLHEMGATFSPSSVRADAIDDEKARLLASSGHRSIALGVEAGSQKLRASLGKGISDARFLEASGTLARHGITNIRLYFMLGLPNETPEDIEAIADMARHIYAEIETHAPRTRRAAGVSITVTTFVPKPSTALGEAPFAGKREIKEKIKRLQRAIRNDRGIELRTDPYPSAEVEHLIANGGPEIVDFLESAHELGGPRPALKMFRERSLGD